MNLKDSIEKLPLVGPAYAKRLEKLGIKTIEDLLFHFPFRYDDFSLISPIARVQAGETVTIRGKVESVKNEYTKNGKQIQRARVSDSSGHLNLTWFNQPYLAKTFKIGEEYFFSGKVNWFGRQKALVSPEYEAVRAETLDGLPANIHTGRLVPVYPETAGLSSKWIRSKIRASLSRFQTEISEFLPTPLLKKESLIPEKEAILGIHFPTDGDLAGKARYRLAFDEMLLVQLSALLRKKAWQQRSLRKKMVLDQVKIAAFISKLPFSLTAAQNRVIKEIFDDLTQEIPMNRLLEGDVGSGKTIVAAIAAYGVFLNGQQTLLMAPTEILAQQHFQTFKALFDPLGIKVSLRTRSKKPKRITREGKKSEEVKEKEGITIGTHSLLYEDFEKDQIGLIVVDEQHRFGVDQRALLVQKGLSPHFLTMTATPIPRTIALTLYGDLDLSVIDELPADRIDVKTWVVPHQKRSDAYNWIRQQVKNTDEQAFIICPLIEESESLNSVKAVTQEFSLLSEKVFPDLRLGLLHGRMKAREKDQVLADFKEGRLDILVSTPVVEVGIDIPQATIMLIEASERFGLAQLHQLRGRVGRSHRQSYCLLFTENETLEVISRLKSLEKTCLGMELAEIDLRLRGPGEILGTKQHGFSDLKLASLVDFDLIKKTRRAAEEILASGSLSLPLKERLKKYKIEAVNN
jgi:ATP-dependent DNA helicase RecG